MFQPVVRSGRSGAALVSDSLAKFERVAEAELRAGIADTEALRDRDRDAVARAIPDGNA